ncbi:alpha/beta hydrolase [Actinoplanes philippinensis]|uniref:alpha/beta hydrolase n=1 Tax=Actinoplanes philippinensis TaxID=35752 RepID=UPI0033E26AB7
MPEDVALAVIDLARAGRFADIEARFAPPLRAAVPADTLRTAWAAEIARIGSDWTVGTPVTEPAGPGRQRVSVPVTGDRDGHTVIVTVDGDGRLHGLRIAPLVTSAWRAPRYARPRRFTEHEVTVGSGPHAVAGTVSLPRRRGRAPGVVLLAGGGPFDRDGSVGADKPLKDIAWGLASRGIAVLRMDKVTHTHAGFTMAEEYLPPALAALDLLRRQPTVDAGRIHLLGHSGGGRAAPRVAAADGSVAGMVVLAGDAAPLPQAAVRAVRHLAAQQPGPAADAAVDAIVRQAALADSPGLSASTPAVDLPFGWPASYWLDLRAYDQVATAAAAGRPMLILQGGRDYQVTVADDLARWRAGLDARPDVTVRVHDAVDHFFFREGDRHVDAAVITDIARWIRPRWFGSGR